MYEERFSSVNHLLNEFENRLLSDCLKILDADGDLRFHSFSTPFRELIRNILHRLAPDDEVLLCSWYKKEADSITRRQRVIYAIQGGLDDEFLADELNIDISEMTADLRKVMKNLNSLTHLNESYYKLSHVDGLKMASDAISFLVGVLLGIEEIRQQIIDAYEFKIHDLITTAVIEDVVGDIDILATHYYIEGVDIENIEIGVIGAKEIEITIDGNVDVEHQYGSDGDYARGDGARNNVSYPYRVTTFVDVAFPLDIEITTDDVKVDNSSHFDDGDEDYEPGDSDVQDEMLEFDGDESSKKLYPEF
ncbi:hypothetical protein [Paenibacillus polymyxa]|uniref:pPIWI-associating nuclease domain-containing protein n=1 Tax=Paenibacillus polymyxa TaxID=1406 RepID=UPI003DA977E8